MKLVTFEHGVGEARLGAIVEGGVLDLSASGEPAFAAMLALIQAGPGAWAVARARIERRSGPIHALAECRLRAPLPRPEQIRDSMSFHQHIKQASFAIARRMAREAGKPGAAEGYVQSFVLPKIHSEQPVYYKANRFSIAGPDEVIPRPAYSRMMDFELEIAAVIGIGGRDIARENALDHVFGLMIFNDFSARDAQAHEMQGNLGPAKGKDFDKANAFGPWLVTLDEIVDPYALRMQARVNGETWCDNSSRTMHWRFEDLIAHISQGETLHPGEVIGSGTVGDGCGLEHERYLADGDLVELEVEALGMLRNRVVASRPAFV